MIYETILKPILFHLDPETAHHLAATFLSLSQRIPFFTKTLSSILEFKSERLEQTLLGMSFPNPVGLAAGFDKTAELFPTMIKMGFGFIEVGTITAKAQPGNEPPRLFRYPEKKALVNRMGFNNPGADGCASTLSEQKKNFGIRGVNVGKSKLTPLEESVSDYVYSIQTLLPYANYLVINISSPNTPGLRSLQSKNALIELVSGIRKSFPEKTLPPLFVKFAPDLNESELKENLKVCLEQNVDGVILTNTTLDKDLLGPGDHPEGGLSGSPLFEKSLSFVRIAYQQLQGKIPIIGVGGIDSGEKAWSMISQGANLIQVYTGYIYEGPFLPFKLNQFLDKKCKEKGFTSIAQAVGCENHI